MQVSEGEQEVCMFEEGMTIPHPDSSAQVYCGFCNILQSQTLSHIFIQHT
jgi:hypothetical protein